MTFTLDTSGRVITELSEAFETYYEWRDLDAFTQGYIGALFESEGAELRTANRAIALAETGLTPDDDESEESAAAFEALYPVGFSDLAPETLARIIADCAAFQTATAGEADNGKSLWRYLQHGRPNEMRQSMGRDFWASRNGTPDFLNAWPLPYAADLNAAARAFPPLTVQLDESGKVVFA